MLYHASSQCDALRTIHSFPTRRSSDLKESAKVKKSRKRLKKSSKCMHFELLLFIFGGVKLAIISPGLDRKSTRLNSSHVAISYAVFCLKKKQANMWSTLLRLRSGTMQL